jgi:hypothetical protein
MLEGERSLGVRSTGAQVVLGIMAAFCVSFISLRADDLDYLMIRLGNEWIFDVVSVESNGAIEKGTAHRIVNEQVERDGHKYFRGLTTVQSSHPLEYTKLLRTDASGLYSLAENARDSREEHEIVLPFKVGDTWETAAGSTKNAVVGQESVTVNGKPYEDCFHIRSESKLLSIDYWQARGVGMVRLNAMFKDGKKMTLALREFKPAK